MNAIPVPEEVMRQLLTEACTTTTHDILSIDYSTAKKARMELGVSDPPLSSDKVVRSARAAILRRRWHNWREQPPEPISEEALMGLVQAEVDRRRQLAAEAQSKRAEAKARAPAKPPLTPGALVVAVRRFHEEQRRWPTVSEIAAVIDYTQPTVNDAARRGETDGLIVREEFTLIATDRTEQARITDRKWRPERIYKYVAKITDRNHQASIPGRNLPIYKAPTPPRTIVITQDTEPPKTQETQSVPKEAAEMKWHRGNWPADEALVAEWQDLVNRGEPAVRIMAEKYDVSQASVSTRLKESKTRLGMDPSNRTYLVTGKSVTPMPKATVQPDAAGRPERETTDPPAKPPVAPLGELLADPQQAETERQEASTMPPISDDSGPSEPEAPTHIRPTAASYKLVTLILVTPECKKARQLTLSGNDVVPNKGDQWPEVSFSPEGAVRVNVWYCVEAFSTEFQEIRIMRPATAEERQKVEVA